MTVILENNKQPSLLSKEVLLRLAVISLVAAFLLGALVSVLYRQELRSEQRLLQEQGLQRVERETAFIERELRTIRSDLLYLSEQQLMEKFFAAPAEMRDSLSQEFASFAEKRKVYDQIRLLDNSGMEIVRVNFREGRVRIVPVRELQDKQDRYYFKQALDLAPGQAFVSEFDLNVEHGAIEQPPRPVLRFVAPVSKPPQAGMIVLNYNGNYLLNRLNRIALPGRTMIVRDDGYYILGEAARDAWGWLLNHDRRCSKQFPAAWRQMQNAIRGQFTTPQGQFTYRALSMSPPNDAESQRGPRLYLVGRISPQQQRRSVHRLLTQLTGLAATAMAGIIALGWYWAWLAAIRKDQADSIALSEARLRTLSRKLLTAQEDERRSISRELHDDLGQQVTAVRLGLQTAIQRGEAGAQTDLLQLLIDEADQLLQSIHRIATRVRPSVLDDLGLRDALASLVEDLQRRTDLKIQFQFVANDRILDRQTCENLYRIVQEALTNIIKHAQATQATVRIETLEKRTANVFIIDNGRGFVPNQTAGSGLGLLGMQERVDLLGGHFMLQSHPQDGTTISIQLPLTLSDDAARHT